MVAVVVGEFLGYRRIYKAIKRRVPEQLTAKQTRELKAALMSSIVSRDCSSSFC